MALRISKTPNQVPFFPPGIAHHKVVSGAYSSLNLSSKRPQTVKECKMLSKSKSNRMSNSLMSTNNHSHGLRRFSNSTPNLKVCHMPDQAARIHKHNCDMGLSDRGNFKANPLPRYYQSESPERNRAVFDSKNKTRSLERLPSSKSTRNLTGFVPDKPFYPPSKYPSIHDKHDYNIQRLIETRDKYKTPESRKSAHQIARRQSMGNLEKKNNKKELTGSGDTVLKSVHSYGSVPDLNKKDRKNKKEKDSFRDFYGDQMAYTSEIGPYRRSDKLDLHASDDLDGKFSREMTTSYFYPRPIPNQRMQNVDDRMAQSLIYERSLASMILTGSLDRANRNYNLQQHAEITDLDESPTKSISAPKRLNSFSQDSLDGRSGKQKQENHPAKSASQYNEGSDGGKYSDASGDEIGLNSEVDKSTTMSQLEEDELKTLCSNHSDFPGSSGARNDVLENSNYNGNLDQYNIDQLTNTVLSTKNINSFIYSEHNSPISIRNEFINNLDHSIIGKDDQTLLNDLASKCIVSTNQSYEGVLAREYDNLSGLHDEGYRTMRDDRSSKRNMDTDHRFDRTFLPTGDNPDEVSWSHSQRGKGLNDILTTDQYCDRIITDDNLTEVTRLHSRGEDHGEHIKTTPGTDQFYDGIPGLEGNLCTFTPGKSRLDGEFLINQRDFHNNAPEINFFSSLNVQFNGQDYNDAVVGHGEEHRLGKVSRYRDIPRVEFEGDSDATDSSSTNDLSWSRYEENKDYSDRSMPNQRSGIPWVSSPELHSAHCNLVRRPDRYLQSENPLKPMCSFCHKPAYFMERISISNIIFHKSCFRCRKCDTHLNFNNCIIHRKRAYCLVHVRPKIWKSVRSASANKLNQIKERLDNKSNMQKQSSTEVRQQKRIFYEGMNSAKTKFLDDATKIKEPQLKEQKRVTPPRQGVNSGIIESEPKARDPNIVACRDSQQSYFDEMTMLTQSNSAKDTLAHFKELQGKSYSSKEVVNGNADESTMSRRADVIPVDTKSLRNRFLVGANDSDVKLTKINPSDEIQRLIQGDGNCVYENDPESRTDVVKSDSPKENETASPISRNRAKEMKEKFTNFTQDDKPKKSEFKLEYGEGGVYESNPQENHEDVVKHNYDNTVYLPENTVKSGLQKIKDLQDIKSQGYQKLNKEPIKLDIDQSQSGIYENVPEQSRADSISYQNEASLIEFREKNYTNEAKRAFLDRQKQEEDASTKRSTPNMIDIWKDLCADSGVFENQPKEQRKDVVKYDGNSDELMVQSEVNAVNGEATNEHGEANSAENK